MEVEEFLEHHGILGMKWGHRKSKLPLHENYRQTQFNYDKQMYSRAHAVRVNAHMHAGKTLKEARSIERKREVRNAEILGGASIGLFLTARFAPEIMGASEKLLMKAAVKAAARRGQKFAEKKAAQEAANFAMKRGVTNYQTVRLNYDSKSGIWS